jgi:L-lysine exporter family protein LysE/ArgO
MDFSLLSFIQGLTLSFSLIISIGLQNSFVLKQGIAKSHNLIIALICASGDSILILAGVYGLGAILEANALLLKIFYWGGVLFLIAYAAFAFRSSFKRQKLDISDQQKVLSLKKVIITSLVVTFLNPNAYLDTCVLIGSISTQIAEPEKLSFAMGAMLASVIWFFTLSFGARFLAPIFAKPKAWRVLDFIIGCTMLAIAISLIQNDIT